MSPSERRRAARARVVLACVAVSLGQTPGALAAQEPGTVVGLVVGLSSTELLWQPSVATRSDRGAVIGVFADVAAPMRWLSVRAEGALVRRSGDVLSDVNGQALNGRVSSDNLTVTVTLKAGRRVGPARVHLGFGPTLDQPLRRRTDALLAGVLDEEHQAVFGVVGEVGISALLGRWSWGVDARLVEGLSDAFSGNFNSVRFRSTEVLLRVGRPLRRR